MLFALVAALLVLGCERKPEDLEQWRNAEGGMEKMVQWAKSSEEPMPVRKRAVEILMEQGNSGEVRDMLDGMKKEGPEREQLVAAAIGVLEKQWAARDYPTLDEATAKQGGAVKVGDSKSVMAKDAAYYLHPYAKGEDQERLEAILAAWLSQDHQLRNQLGETTLGQILPRAGDEGFEGMIAWFKESKRPGNIAKDIRKHADDKTRTRFAKVIAEKAKKAHPEISKELEVVILETEDEAIVPFLEFAIESPKSAPTLADAAMDAYIRIKGVKATPFLAKLVTENEGLMRWVAITRLIELRGTAGVLQGVNALPLDAEGYPAEGKNMLSKEWKYFCNIIKSELEKKDVKDPKPTVERMLGLSRWPAQVLGLKCTEMYEWSSLKPKVEALSEDEQVIPHWTDEEGEPMTVGALASDVAEAL